MDREKQSEARAALPGARGGARLVRADAVGV